MRWRAWGALGALAVAAMPPACSLDCDGARWSSRPDSGGDRLVACARPMFFAMPGQGGDAPGWLILRDATGWIRGIVSLEMVAGLDMPATWEERTIYVPLHADFTRPGPLAAPLAFVVDRWWRWRAFLGLTRADTEFR